MGTWPSHCVAGLSGSDYHPALDISLIDEHFRKGQGVPAYSMFEGVDDAGHTLVDALAAAGVTAVDVGGLATDYCVRATALDALHAGLHVRLLTDLVAGVAPRPPPPLSTSWPPPGSSWPAPPTSGGWTRCERQPGPRSGGALGQAPSP